MMKNTLRPGSIALGLGLMLTTLCQAQQWSGEQNLGGNLLGGPGVGLIPNAGSDPQSTRIVDLIQVFYEGGDQGLWTRWRNSDVNSGVSWSRQEQGLGGQLFSLTCADVTNSSCWGNNATPVATKIPDPADGLGPGHLEVFYRGSDNHLHARLRPPDGNWGPDQDLGGQLSSDPSVALVPGTEQIEVFYRGADGRLKTQWGDLNSWVYETDMGGQLFGPTCTDVTNDSCYGAYATPAAIQLPGTNDLEVFYRGPDNTLRARLRDDTGTWGGEQDLGGQLSSDPSVAPVPGSDSIEIFYRGADGSLKTQFGDLRSWVYEVQVPGNGRLLGYYCDNPAPGGCLGYAASYSVPKAYTAGNFLWVFYRGADSTIWTQAWVNGGWQLPYSLGGQPKTDISAAQVPGTTDMIQIFYVEPACNGCNGGFLASKWWPSY